MNKTTFTTFRSIDYKNTDALSTYCIEIAPLLFVPDISDQLSRRVVWDFGDNTTSRNISALKTYKFPGIYNVSLIVYDCDTNAMISTFNKQIEVYNFIPFTFNISIDSISYLLTEDGYYMLTEDESYILVNEPNLIIKNGQFSNELIVNSYYPNYQNASSIYYTVDGSNSLNYWDIKNNKFSHLQNSYSLYEKVYNFYMESYQFNPISKLDFNPIELYAKVYNNSIIYCDKKDEGAIFVGLSASKSVYIKDDTIVDSSTIQFKFDKTNNIIFDRNQYINPQYFNTLGIDLKYQIIENDNVERLSITSSGLDGEYYPISSFLISDIKFFDSKIPFVVKIKDSLNTSVKNFPIIQLSSLDISVYMGSDNADAYMTTEQNDILNDSYDNPLIIDQIILDDVIVDPSEYEIISLNDTLSSYDHTGSFRGYIKFPHLDKDHLSNIYIKISGSFINNQSIFYELNTISNKFNISDINYYDIWKINEDFDPQTTLMDLRFQETLLDKNVLFEDFLGNVLGNSESDHEALGVKIYEKISNFTQNIQDIDSCELDFLDSLGQFIGYNDKGEERYTYPEKIKRLVNLGSIDKFKLTGVTNKFRENFDIRGRTTKEEYGINIGDKIDSMTYIVNSNTPIVALEKFSNVYTLLNTYQPLSSTYPLSSYSQDWGWPLVLPDIVNFSDIEKYYLFFEYVEQYDNTPIGGIIDFNNNKTTISIDDINNDTFKHMSMDTLYQMLELID
jgi:hypothetical protein